MHSGICYTVVSSDLSLSFTSKCKYPCHTCINRGLQAHMVLIIYPLGLQIAVAGYDSSDL